MLLDGHAFLQLNELLSRLIHQWIFQVTSGKTIINIAK